MPDCAPFPEPTGCPLPASPCDQYYALWQSIAAGGISGEATTYRVGEETFQLARMSFNDKLRLLDMLYNACIGSGGCVPNLNPTKRRANICFVPGDHRCRICRRSSCGCGS